MKKALFASPLLLLAPVALLFFSGSRKGGGGRPDLNQLPPTTLPPTVDPMRDLRLLSKPTEGIEIEIDDLYDRWVRDPRSGAPELTTVDLIPRVGKRGLTAFERWALADFFYVADLEGEKLHMGMRPPELVDKLAEAGQELPEAVAAFTMPDGSVWFPHGPKPLHERWWLSILAHELYHSGQVRLGSTLGEATEAIEHWGYIDSPLEVSARWKQREVYDGMGERAQMFFEEV